MRSNLQNASVGLSLAGTKLQTDMASRPCSSLSKRSACLGFTLRVLIPFPRMHKLQIHSPTMLYLPLQPLELWSHHRTQLVTRHEKMGYRAYVSSIQKFWRCLRCLSRLDFGEPEASKIMTMASLGPWDFRENPWLRKHQWETLDYTLQKNLRSKISRPIQNANPNTVKTWRERGKPGMDRKNDVFLGNL